MPKSSTWVLKLGGAMMRARELADWLGAFGAARDGPRCVVVAGGGGLADVVRELHAEWRFEDGLAHALAIETMGLNARILAALAPGMALTDACTADALPAGHCIWLPPRPCPDLGLPESWQATADSIAYALGCALGAERVVLVKSVGADRLAGRTLDELAASGIVDDYLPRRVRGARPRIEVLDRAACADFARRLEAAAAPSGAA
ncbi:MAG: amino acid kinase family protein [Gammaproteobacteria bacterium]